jgi:hypothetical protein
MFSSRGRLRSGLEIVDCVTAADGDTSIALDIPRTPQMGRAGQVDLSDGTLTDAAVLPVAARMLRS